MWGYDVEARGREEVPEERDLVEAEAQAGRAEVEFCLVVRADEPKFALNDLKTSLFAQTLKLLRSHLGTLDAQQFIDFGGIFLEYS